MESCRERMDWVAAIGMGTSALGSSADAAVAPPPTAGGRCTERSGSPGGEGGNDVCVVLK